MTEYTPKVWQEGDPITDIDLNRIEERLIEILTIQRVWYVETEGN